MFDAAYPPPVVGGKEKQAHLLSKALVERDIDVNVITFSKGRTVRESVDGVPVLRYASEPLGRLRALYALIGMWQPKSVLHVHTPSRIGMLFAIIGFIRGFRIVFKLPNEGLLEKGGGFNRRLRVFVVKHAHMVVCLESDSVTKLISIGVPAGRIMAADNGVEYESDMVSQQSDSGLTTRPYFVFVSRLVEHKRCADALSAFEASGLAAHGVGLLIVGDGPQREMLETLVREKALEDSIEFSGYCEDPITYIRNAYCLVLCSEREGMPNVLLEAMSVGVPIIATRAGAIPSMLSPMGIEYLFDAGDVHALEKLMRSAWENKAALKEYAKWLRQLAERKYCISRVADRYVQRYLDLVNTHSLQ